MNSHEEVGEWGTNLENRLSSWVFYHMYKKTPHIKHNKTPFTKKTLEVVFTIARYKQLHTYTKRKIGV